MLKQLRIWLWKRRARKHYRAAKAAFANCSCGWELARQISAEVCFHSNMFNRCMDELAKLDSKTPKDRL